MTRGEAHAMITDEMVEAAARSDAEFDKRGWLEMPKHERERYLARARKSLTAALAKAWRQIEGAPKDGSEFIAGNIGYQPFSCIWSQRDRCFLHFKDGGEAISYGFDYWMPLPAPPATKGAGHV